MDIFSLHYCSAPFGAATPCPRIYIANTLGTSDRCLEFCSTRRVHLSCSLHAIRRPSNGTGVEVSRFHIGMTPSSYETSQVPIYQTQPRWMGVEAHGSLRFLFAGFKEDWILCPRKSFMLNRTRRLTIRLIDGPIVLKSFPPPSVSYLTTKGAPSTGA